MSSLLSFRQFLLVAIFIAAAPNVLSQSSSPLPVVSLNAGIHLIRAEVAADDATRQQGLMFREKMGTNEGMIFRFPEPAAVCMWMKNTLLPLSVAFIDEDGKIVNIEDMKPQTTDSHCAAKPVRYALEMNKGWFQKRNIKPGTVIGGISRP